MAGIARLVALDAPPGTMGRMQSVSEARVSRDCWQRGNSTYRGVAGIVVDGVKVVAKVYTRSIESYVSQTRMTMVFCVDRRAP